VRDNQVGLDDQADSAGPAPENDKVQVEQVNPDLVARDDERSPYGVSYEAVNAMLLNEFLKEHRKVEEQQASITELRNELQANAARQQEQIEALTAGLHKVSAQLGTSRPAPQMVFNNQ